MRKLLIAILLIPLFATSQITDTWDAVKVGVTDMQKIYVGNTLVWQKLTPAQTIKDGLYTWSELDDAILPTYVGYLDNEHGTNNIYYEGNNNTFDTYLTGKLGFSIERLNNYQYDGISSGTFSTGTGYSISLWFNGDVSATDFDDYLWLFQQEEEGLRIYKTVEGNLYIDSYVRNNSSGSDHIYQYTLELATNTWHHIVYTRTLSEVNFYVDGNLIKTQSGSFLNFSSGIRFDGYLTHDSFKGKYDQIIIWNRAINSGEVDYVWNDGLGRSYSSIP